MYGFRAHSNGVRFAYTAEIMLYLQIVVKDDCFTGFYFVEWNKVDGAKY